MKILIFGAGSFLGRNFLEYSLKQKLVIYGVSQHTNNSKVINTDYSSKSLYKIIKKIKPDVFFDFKSHLVSSNKEHYSKDLYYRYSENIVDAVSSYIANIDPLPISLNLISTHYLNEEYKDNIDLNHPYLIYKKNQEELYERIKNSLKTYKVIRLPNVVGAGDLNFSRLLPFYIGSQISKQSPIFNSSELVLKKYLTLNNFCKNLHSQTLIDSHTVTLSNDEIISEAKKYFRKIGFECKKEIWKNNKDVLSIFGNSKVSNSNFLLEDFKNNIGKTIDWYLNNSNKTREEYFKFVEGKKNKLKKLD